MPPRPRFSRSAPLPCFSRPRDFGLPPPEDPPAARFLRIALCVRRPAVQAQVKAQLRELVGVRWCAPTEAPDVLLYAAASAAEFVTLLGPQLTAPSPAALFDLTGAIAPETVALLGLLGYLPASASPSQVQYGLQEVARGWSYAPEPFDGMFHGVRESGRCLTSEEKQLLRLVGQGYTQEQIEAVLSLSRSTVQRRVQALKRRLGLRPREPLPVGAARLGFLPAPPPPDG